MSNIFQPDFEEMTMDDFIEFTTKVKYGKVKNRNLHDVYGELLDIVDRADDSKKIAEFIDYLEDQYFEDVSPDYQPGGSMYKNKSTKVPVDDLLTR